MPPTELGAFTGFGPGAMGFLSGLDADNSKQFFDANRSVYDTDIAQPLKELVVSVGERLVDGVAPGISFEPKIGKSLFRINRDLRFSKDKTPYHSHLDVAWWQGDHPKTSPAFICRIRADQVLTGVGVYALDRERLDRFRRAVVGPEGADLMSAVETAKASTKGATLSEPSRKRVPKGFDPNHPRAHYLLFDGLHLSRSEPTPTSITSRRFARWVADRLANYGDVHRWLVANT